ncbi:MAG TPA: response regulator [Candidatus Cloacimonadota bacterium]|nr:response regulator [Candidatus Cloacimonadota bacterium]
MDDRICLLIVEDDDEHYTLISRSFYNQTDYYQLIHADTIAGAIKLVEENSPDLIVSDWKLPDGEGVDLLSHKLIHGHIPVVLMTSFGSEKYAVKAIKMGALDYIVKSTSMFNEFPHLVSRFIKDWNNQKTLEIKDKELARMNDRMKNILECSPFGIFEMDELYHIEYYNQTLLKIFHISIDIALSFETVIDDKARDRIKESLKRVFRNRTYERFDCKLFRMNQEEFFADIQIVPLTYSDTKNLLIIITDMTEKKKVEEYLVKENKLNSIGLLAGGVAHDFNNILSAILGNISLCKYSMTDCPEQTGLLEDAEKACRRAKGLTQQLLTFSKGGAPIKEKTDILETIEDSARFVVRGSKVNCEFMFNSDVKPVLVDKGQLSQVIQNIVINAVQSMPNGGQVTVKVSNYDANIHPLPGLSDQTYIQISIEDQGTGISDEDLKYIFDPYFTTKDKGNGLGLTICYSIIKQHNGLIDVESVPGTGTRFHIYLPATSEQLRKNDEVTSRPELNNQDIRVLVMDDDAMIRTMVQKILLRFNYLVDFAEDGNQLIDKYKSGIINNNPYHIVLTDLTIQGGLGGKECLDILKRINPNIRCIVMSGYSNDPVVADFKKHGFTARIIKPFSINDLLQTIKEIAQTL